MANVLFRVIAFAGFAISAVAAASAQEGVNAPCVNQVNGAYDAIASADWQARFQRTDRQALGQVAGVWYTEIQSPDGSMISYQYYSYQPTQILDVQSRTCGTIPTCTDSYGTGMFAAETQGDGSIFITINYSDNNRRNACSGGYYRVVDPGTMVNAAGNVMKRVR